MKFRNFYRRLFLYEKTCTITAILSILLTVTSMISGHFATRLNTFDYLDYVLQIILILFLFYGYIKHNILAMQAGCCGLLVSLVYHQANYTLNDLLGLGSNYIMGLGFWGSFFLACELMVLILEIFFLFNHFENFILRKRDYLRIVVNQTCVCILFFFLLLLIFVISKLVNSTLVTIYFVSYDLSLIATYMLIACNELILAIDVEG